MNPKPSTFSIILNDRWAAPMVGAFVATLIMASVVTLLNHFVSESKSISQIFLALMIGVTFIAAIITVIFRVRQVQRIFENGTMVEALVVASSMYKSTMRLTLRYTYLRQTYEKKLDQVVTERTQKVLYQNKVTVIFDPNMPDHILLREAYD